MLQNQKKIKKYAFLVFLFTYLSFLTNCSEKAPAQEQLIRSPNGNIVAKVFVNKAGTLFYTVLDSDTPIISESRLGITVDSINLGMKAVLGKAIFDTIDDTYPVLGKKKIAKHHAVQITIPITSHNKTYTLQVRAQDNGVAIRYILPEGSKTLNSDNTTIVPVTPEKAGWQPFANSYETEDNYTAWNDVPNQKPLAGLLTIKLPHNWLFIAEANNANYPDYILQRDTNTIKSFWKTRPEGFEITTPEQLTTPWNTITITNNLNDLVNATMLTDQCPPPATDIDFSFVKPGRILWQWCSIGAPLLNDQHDWYDAAAKLHWEYYMIDDGWRDWEAPNKDKWQLLKDVIDYGKTKGVETIIWVDSKEIIKSPEARTAYLEKVKATGAVGIKIDFIPPGNEKIMQWYDETLRETAKYGLMTIFHGCEKPTGRERTWPHALTREGIRGNEWHMTRYNRKQRLDHDEIQPFTRFLAGAGDITPLVADPEQLNGFTLPHMLAQTIIQTSPLTCFYDHYKFYVGSPIEDLLTEIPVVWDETTVLPITEIGKTAAFARKSGKTWWVAIVNGEDEKTVSIPFDFINGTMKATIITDADKPEDVNRKEKTIAPNDTITFNLKKGGGVLVRLVSN